MDEFDKNLDHPGGVQAHGNTLAVAMESGEKGRAAIYFLHFPPGLKGTIVNKLFLTGAQGEPFQKDQDRASSAGFLKLQSGKFLAAVSGEDHGKQGIWFYLSSTSKIFQTTKWNYIDFWTPPCKEEFPGNHECYLGSSGMSLIASCDGHIYIITMHGTDGNRGKEFQFFQVYQLNQTENRNLNLELIYQQNDNTEVIQINNKAFRWAGGTYITEKGGIALINTERCPQSKNPKDAVNMDVYYSKFVTDGCTDKLACNFNPNATNLELGSCKYPEKCFLKCDSTLNASVFPGKQCDDNNPNTLFSHFSSDCNCIETNVEADYLISPSPMSIIVGEDYCFTITAVDSDTKQVLPNQVVNFIIKGANANNYGVNYLTDSLGKIQLCYPTDNTGFENISIFSNGYETSFYTIIFEEDVNEIVSPFPLFMGPIISTTSAGHSLIHQNDTVLNAYINEEVYTTVKIKLITLPLASIDVHIASRGAGNQIDTILSTNINGEISFSDISTEVGFKEYIINAPGISDTIKINWRLFEVPPDLGISISDPCDCLNGIDLDNDGINDLLQEIISINSGSPPYIVSNSSNNFFDNNGNQLSNNDLSTLLNNGNVSLIVYVPANGSIHTITVEDSLNNIASVSGGPCSSCQGVAPAAIPTLSQWGLIILTLLFFTTSSVMVIREQHKLVLENTSKFSLKPILFDFPLYFQLFIKGIPFILLAFIIFTIIDGGLFVRNLIGSFVSATIIIYLLHFIKLIDSLKNGQG